MSAATKSPPKESTVPIEIIDKAKQNPIPNPQYSKGRVSALGVLAEVDTVLQNHKNSFSPKLTGDLSPKIKELLPKLGIKNLSDTQLNQIVQEVTTETTRQALEDAATISSTQELPQVLADSIVDSLAAHPELSEKLLPQRDKIYQNIKDTVLQTVQTNQADLEKTAVLGALSDINRLAEPDAQIDQITTESIEDAVSTNSQLTPMDVRAGLKKPANNYLETYVGELSKQLSEISGGDIPTFEQLQSAKEQAHEEATEKIKGSVPSQIGHQNLTNS
ncbi:MAG: hypothetical protein Q8P25_03280, partial [Candidatus Curtissbacteria bacterium]|nr:hypothetical protein [Candidatus Curtissbacteria bacterium]